MKRLVIALLIQILPQIALSAAADVCTRTPHVVASLEEETGKTCDQISAADLSRVRAVFVRDHFEGLTSLKLGDFDGLTSIEAIDLEYNALTTLPEGIFTGLTSLRTIALTGNEISELPPRVFSGLSNLIYLLLSHNQLTTLSSDIFADLKSMRMIFLQGNPLQQVSPEVFSAFPANPELMTRVQLEAIAYFDDLNIQKQFTERYPYLDFEF
jgi:hypothetical protein